MNYILYFINVNQVYLEQQNMLYYSDQNFNQEIAISLYIGLKRHEKFIFRSSVTVSVLKHSNRNTLKKYFIILEKQQKLFFDQSKSNENLADVLGKERYIYTVGYGK